MHWVRRIAFLFILALLLAVGGFFVFRGFNFSPEDVSLTIEAPEEVDAGIAFPVRVVLANSSRATLQDITVTLSAPSETLLLEGADGEQRGNDVIVRLEDLETLQKKTLAFQFSSSADAGATILFRAKVEFRPHTSVARFTQEAQKNITVARVPVTLEFSFPEQIRAGEDFSFSMRLRSDASRTLERIRLLFFPPPQFSFRESLPDPCRDLENCWDIDRLLPGEEQEIIVRGAFAEGDIEVEFRAQAGAHDLSRDQFRSYSEVTEKVRVAAPIFTLVQWVGETKDPKGWALDPGQKVTVRLAFENRSKTVLENIALRLILEGKAVDSSSFEASEDFVRLSAGEYRWDPADVFSLRFMRPGEAHDITFSFEVADPVPFTSLSDANPKISSRVTAQSSQGLLAENTVSFQVNTTLTLHQQVLFSNAPGGRNSGPLPPRVGETTTYTVVWQVVGGVNGARNVIVRAVLGPSVKYVAVLEPSGANVSYDAQSKEVIWPIGDMLPGTGFFTPPKELVFRIALTPQEGDIGTIPELIDFAKVSGDDAFTGVAREHVLNEPVRADLPDESTVDDQRGTVESSL